MRRTYSELMLEFIDDWMDSVFYSMEQYGVNMERFNQSVEPDFKRIWADSAEFDLDRVYTCASIAGHYANRYMREEKML